MTTSETIEKELKSHSWTLVQIVVFGLAALILAPFGESSLTRSSPIFDYLGLTYGAWQVGYFVGLVVLTLVWLLAVSHRMRAMAHLRKQRDLRLRLEADRAVIDEKRRAKRAAQAEAAAAAIPVPRPRPPPAPTRSTKFDY